MYKFHHLFNFKMNINLTTYKMIYFNRLSVLNFNFVLLKTPNFCIIIMTN